MASVQVLSNSAVSSRKQEHLEAGKRRLEEFRKKKAADQAKKAASAGQPAPADTIDNNKQVLENGKSRFLDSKGAGTSGRTGDAISEPSIAVANDSGNLHSFTHENEVESQTHMHTDSLVLQNYGSFSSDLSLTWPTEQRNQRVDHLGPMYPRNINFGLQKEEKIGDHVTRCSERRSADVASPYQYNSNDIEASRASSKSFIFDDKECTGQVPFQPATHETFPKRSRPSFLDSINMPRASSSSSFSNSQLQSVEVHNSIVASESQEHFGQNGNLELPFRNANSHDNNINRNHVEKNLDLLQQKPSEDFAALEQHIEDLTQEKFSLQHALEASKTLAESLAAENSSLTESFNQQGGVVAQLKSEMVGLQTEINTLLAELESLRVQYANAQLECNAADERAKLLASEVIVLEEKALKLRSSELKVEKELEKSNAKVASCKKRMSSLETERQDLHMTIDALQEEKKLLQSKLWKAAKSQRSFDNNERKSTKNVSTSTDDLDVVLGGEADMPATSNSEALDISASSTSVDNLQIVGQNGAFGFDASAMFIPSDQVQMIQNINTFLSELMAEKEDLSQALVAEISRSFKLKDFNNELSQKLEVQTQRLELLTAQSMAKESFTARQPVSSQTVQENVLYADEGDEAVDRVFGWIMKMFPGGPSRRRTSKLL